MPVNRRFSRCCESSGRPLGHLIKVHVPKVIKKEQIILQLQEKSIEKIDSQFIDHINLVRSCMIVRYLGTNKCSGDNPIKTLYSSGNKKNSGSKEKAALIIT